MSAALTCSTVRASWRGIPLSELPVRELQQAARALAAARVVREPLLVGRVSTVPPCSAEAVLRLRAAVYKPGDAGQMEDEG